MTSLLFQGLGNHNYCRNPDGDSRPWCWVRSNRNEFDYCVVPRCSELVTTDQPIAMTSKYRCFLSIISWCKKEVPFLVFSVIRHAVIKKMGLWKYILFKYLTFTLLNIYTVSNLITNIVQQKNQCSTFKFSTSN